MQRLAAGAIEYDIIRSFRFARNASLALIACAAPAGAQGLDDALDYLLEDEIEAQVEAEIEVQIEAQIESAVQTAIERQVESTVAESIELGIEVEVGETIGIGIDADAGIAGGLSEALDDLIGSLTAESQDSARLAAGVDPDNRAIEAEVWVVLVPVQYADRIETWGFTLLERRDLEALDRVLLRVEAPEDREIAEAALEFALDAPGTVVDYNHVYESAIDGNAVDEPAGSPGRPASSAGSSGAPFTIGMVDSIVDPSHPALEGFVIEQRDFVPFANERTVAHGTAVASIIVGAAGGSMESARLEKLRAASVFFKDDGGNVRATTAGLVAAIDWLAGAPDLDVINMSLAGPPNELLEVALADLAMRDIVVVAAVGNNGPIGAPLYPAAYDTVVGVTAVDSSHRVYRYANRGRQVMFSAPGVRIPVASPSGGFSTQSGTSLAAPLVAALIAESMAAGPFSSAEALQRFQETALDLGERAYDEIYGYGLVRRMK
ncbi:MAG TPA: S8 family serine peptidase [Gammaproteobacteria bacterium]|nr:S8 family serine peptidase [Gammaproteobacteria bacterium]